MRHRPPGDRCAKESSPDQSARVCCQMVKLSRLIMIFDWRRQGLSISAIARKTGLCRKTIRQHLKRGLENPASGPPQTARFPGTASGAWLVFPVSPWLNPFAPPTPQRVAPVVRQLHRSYGFIRLLHIVHHKIQFSLSSCGPFDWEQYEDLPGSRQKACRRAWVL